jgi:hypothetical protein
VFLLWRRIACLDEIADRAIEISADPSPGTDEGVQERGFLMGSAGGEDYGYFASEAGGAGFESCRGNYARVV